MTHAPGNLGAVLSLALAWKPLLKAGNPLHRPGAGTVGWAASQGLLWGGWPLSPRTPPSPTQGFSHSPLLPLSGSFPRDTNTQVLVTQKCVLPTTRATPAACVLTAVTCPSTPHSSQFLPRSRPGCWSCGRGCLTADPPLQFPPLCLPALASCSVTLTSVTVTSVTLTSAPVTSFGHTLLPAGSQSPLLASRPCAPTRTHWNIPLKPILQSPCHHTQPRGPPRQSPEPYVGSSIGERPSRPGCSGLGGASYPLLRGLWGACLPDLAPLTSPSSVSSCPSIYGSRVRQRDSREQDVPSAARGVWWRPGAFVTTHRAARLRLVPL